MDLYSYTFLLIVEKFIFVSLLRSFYALLRPTLRTISDLSWTSHGQTVAW